jgi:hypothetical protein
VFLAPDGASVVKVVPLLHPAGARVEGEVALQRAAGALALSPAVRAVTFSRAFAFVAMERVHGDTEGEVHRGLVGRVARGRVRVGQGRTHGAARVPDGAHREGHHRGVVVDAVARRVAAGLTGVRRQHGLHAVVGSNGD